MRRANRTAILVALLFSGGVGGVLVLGLAAPATALDATEGSVTFASDEGQTAPGEDDESGWERVDTSAAVPAEPGAPLPEPAASEEVSDGVLPKTTENPEPADTASGKDAVALTPDATADPEGESAAVPTETPDPPSEGAGSETDGTELPGEDRSNPDDAADGDAPQGIVNPGETGQQAGTSPVRPEPGWEGPAKEKPNPAPHPSDGEVLVPIEPGAQAAAEAEQAQREATQASQAATITSEWSSSRGGVDAQREHETFSLSPTEGERAQQGLATTGTEIGLPGVIGVLAAVLIGGVLLLGARRVR